MTASHTFVDESLRRRYILCAVVVPQTQLREIRRVLRGLCNPGQRRLHMNDESDRRRRQILSAVVALEIRAHIYQTRLGSRSERVVRDDCLRRLVADVPRLATDRIVLESCSQDRQDNLAIREASAKLPEASRPVYLHCTPAIEPLLWLPDVVAWAYGRGGDWSRRSETVVSGVTDIEA